jgi:hypothetical protein
MNIEDYKKALLAAGKLALASQAVLDSQPFTLSYRLSELMFALSEYDAIIIALTIRNEKTN